MNIDIKDNESSYIDSMSAQSEDGPTDKFIWLTKDGMFSSDLINIYFKIDYLPDKKWLINTRPKDSMDEFCTNIVKYLYNEFDEFCDLSGLKITQLTRVSDGSLIPFTKTVSTHLVDGEEIIWEIESLDIWINVYLYLKSNDKAAQAYVKMRAENHLTTLQIKSMLQKLGLIIWNKYWNESGAFKNEKSTLPSPRDTGKYQIRKTSIRSFICITS